MVVIGAAVTCVAGCTLASPTYITTQSAPEPAADASAPSSASTLTSGAASDSTTACAGGTFAKVDIAKLAPCGNGLGHCYDKTKTPGAEQLVACPTATEVCVPDDILLAAGAKLQSCTSIIGPGGCVAGSLIPAIAAQGGSALKQDVCKTGRICVPCTDPTHGNAPTPFCSPVGVMESACATSAAGDAGAPPPPSQKCCTKQGRSNGICIAETAVPEARRSQTVQDTCTSGNRCVPSALAAGNPSSCNAGSAKGVCMDTCFNDMLNLASSIGFLGQDWCGPTEVCIPCAMVSGQGVPGCP